MNLIMNQYQFLRKFIFSLFIILVACDSNSTSIPDEEVHSISFENGQEQIYSISIDNETIGTNNVTITTGIQRTIDDVSYSFVIEYKETVEFSDSTGELNTYFKEYADGHIYFSWENGPIQYKFIPFPIKYGESLYGPFGILNTDSILITITNFHDTYINHNNHSFSNVFEAENSSGTIRVFINEDYFIIQKEDYRYGTTIQSLILE